MTNKLACVVFLSICTYYTCQARYTANLESSHNYLDDTSLSNQENNQKDEPSRSGRLEPTRKILEDIPETFQPRKSRNCVSDQDISSSQRLDPNVIQLGSKRDYADPGCRCNGCPCIDWPSDDAYQGCKCNICPCIHWPSDGPVLEGSVMDVNRNRKELQVRVFKGHSTSTTPGPSVVSKNDFENKIAKDTTSTTVRYYE